MPMPLFSMTETLFGGLLFAFILFGLARKFGLSSFWAAILSGILPFFIYLFLIKDRWPSGDVVTIHFAVYLANAGILMVFGDLKDKKQRLHWAPKLLVGFFIFLAILNAVLLSIASHGIPNWLSGALLPRSNSGDVHTTFPGTIQHEKNKSYAAKLESFEQQTKLGWQIQVDGLGHIKQHQSSDILVRLTDKQHQPVTGAQLSLELMRLANSADDQVVTFKETSAGLYAVKALLAHEGRWMTNLIIQQGKHSYSKKQTVFVDAAP